MNRHVSPTSGSGVSTPKTIKSTKPLVLTVGEVCYYTGLTPEAIENKIDCQHEGYDHVFVTCALVRDAPSHRFLASGIAHWLDRRITWRNALMGVNYA